MNIRTVFVFLLFGVLTNILLALELVEEETEFPPDWPAQWNNAIIPYVFDFYTPHPYRLIKIVNKGLEHLRQRSCLVFKEYDPQEAAKMKNFTYLYFSFSGVMEDCCLPFYNNGIGRRLVLITPKCTLKSEVAHAILHGFGLTHNAKEPFELEEVKPTLFVNNVNCKDIVSEIVI